MDEFNLPLAINKCETIFGVSYQKIAQYLREYSLFKIKNLISREFLQLNGFKRKPNSFIYDDEEIEIEAISANLDNNVWIITANRKQGFTNNQVYVSTIGQFNMFLSAVGMAERCKQFNKYPAVLYFDEGNGKTSSKLN